MKPINFSSLRPSDMATLTYEIEDPVIDEADDHERLCQLYQLASNTERLFIDHVLACKADDLSSYTCFSDLPYEHFVRRSLRKKMQAVYCNQGAIFA